ncbi:drug/metabolite transporter (DMT)-like permease [Silvibacterium bohemicum]|uniref:Drug/metabolite transporter (DMT)-like permease n=1 Tax=Silvibacterium bohemicum TaxID=1577686 RepID=A0A841JYS4_9BACT|nr:DMT family transporter [Silvibacterium bohemicum]MBB6146512.1 drug/metabolite transporter (DMT)-like permease [Silvibacterium bohemicum]
MSRSLKAHLLLLGVVIVWGSTFVLVKDALADISPLLFNLLRMGLATLCLGLVYRRHIGRMDGRTIFFGCLTGFFLAMGYQFQTAGLRLTTPSKSAFITGMVVVIVPLLLVIPRLRPVASHAPAWNAYLGALLAFGGIVLLTTPAGSGAAHSGFDFRSMNVGDLLTLGCALGFAFHMLALAHFSPRVPFEQLAVLQVGFATLFMAISLPVFERPFLHWSVRVVVALTIASVLATAAAFTIQSWAQQFLPATHTALLLTLEPVFAWITSFLFLGERLGLRSGAGALLIFAGIGVTELLPSRIQSTAHEAAPIP